jgi:hypothetical protein
MIGHSKLKRIGAMNKSTSTTAIDDENYHPSHIDELIDRCEQMMNQYWFVIITTITN